MKKEYKIGEGKELYCIIDLSKDCPWYIKWNPLTRLFLTFSWYQRYIDLMDEDGNVRRVYEKLEENKK